jgi:hypothetical protein
MKIKFLCAIFLAVAWESYAGGLEQTFNVSYEAATNKLSELKPNPAAAGFKIPARELVPGKSFEFDLPETLPGDVSGTDTMIDVTNLGPNSVGVRVETIKLGIFFNSHDKKIQRERFDELSQLLSTNRP